MKKNSLLALTMTSILLMSSNAFAAWQELGSNDRMVVYVDVDTIKSVGDKVQIMSMLDFKKPGANIQTKKPVSSIIGINEYDCPAISYRPIEFKEFSGNKGAGSVVSNNNTPNSQFEPVIDDSWTAGVFNVVCKLQK